MFVGTSIQTLHLGVCIKFIEETYTQGQIGVGKQFYCFSLSGTHIQSIYVLLDCALLQQAGKSMGCLLKTRNLFVESNDDSGRIEIIVEGFAFTQELGGENDIGGACTFGRMGCR